MQPSLPDDDITIDRLTARWSVTQLRRGHRFSTDDLLPAWRGAVHAPAATRLLDLGAGIGAVGLSALDLLRDDATLVALEAQDVSRALLGATLAREGLGARVRIVAGDLRDPDVLGADARFDLITGSPPYFPVGTGVISPHPQRAACRFELRGSTVDYAAAAARWLADGGVYAFVMTAADPRVEPGITAAGLAVVERTWVHLREDKAPHLGVWVCRRAEEVGGAATSRRHVVRTAAGALHADAIALRERLGFTVPDHERLPAGRGEESGEAGQVRVPSPPRPLR